MVDQRDETKCVALHLPVCLIQKIDAYKAKTGKSKQAVLVELIEKGLNSS